MRELLAGLGGIAVPVFVVLTMPNVGLAQRPSRIAAGRRKGPFALRMLGGDVVLAPLLIVVAP